MLDAWTDGTAAREAALQGLFRRTVVGELRRLPVPRGARWDVPEALEPLFEAVANRMPIPFRGDGPGSLPRYNAEIGPFVALVAGGSLAGSGGGFDDLDPAAR